MLSYLIKDYRSWPKYVMSVAKSQCGAIMSVMPITVPVAALNLIYRRSGRWWKVKHGESLSVPAAFRRERLLNLSELTKLSFKIKPLPVEAFFMALWYGIISPTKNTIFTL